MHFGVAVFYTKDQSIDDLLYTYSIYNCNILYKEYTKEEAIKYQRYVNDKFFNGKRDDWTDEECYHRIKEEYDDAYIDKDGSLYTLGNPNGKYDFYDIVSGKNYPLKTKSGKEVEYCKISDWDIPEDFATFAVVLPDATWHEKDLDNPEEWNDNYKKRFIDNLNPEWFVAIIDCHI